MWLEFFEKEIETGAAITLYPPPKIKSLGTITIPNDISSAAYWLVLASCLGGSEIILRNVGVNPTRTGILDALLKMGASIELLNCRNMSLEAVADIRIKWRRVRGVSIKAQEIPRLIDEIPILAVAAAYADESTVIHGTGELRVKESDRLAAIIDEFNKIMPGGFAAEGDDLIITPRAEKVFAECNTYGDHRLAMALAIFGALSNGVSLDDTDCVNISYPYFFEQI